MGFPVFRVFYLKNSFIADRWNFYMLNKRFIRSIRGFSGALFFCRYENILPVLREMSFAPRGILPARVVNLPASKMGAIIFYEFFVFMGGGKN